MEDRCDNLDRRGSSRMDERRKHPRITDRNSVAVTVLDAPATPELKGSTFFCLTENISAGGIMLNVGTCVPTESMLELRVAFAHPIRSFDLTGRVVWVEDPDEGANYPIGIEFTGARAGDLDAWRQIVTQKVSVRQAEGPPESSREQS